MFHSLKLLILCWMDVLGLWYLHQCQENYHKSQTRGYVPCVVFLIVFLVIRACWQHVRVAWSCVMSFPWNELHDSRNEPWSHLRVISKLVTHCNTIITNIHRDNPAIFAAAWEPPRQVRSTGIEIAFRNSGLKNVCYTGICYLKYHCHLFVTNVTCMQSFTREFYHFKALNQ